MELLQFQKPSVTRTLGNCNLQWTGTIQTEQLYFLFDNDKENDAKLFFFSSFFGQSLNRYSADHDYEITRFSQFMRSTFGNMSLSQALDEIVSIYLCSRKISRRFSFFIFMWKLVCEIFFCTLRLTLSISCHYPLCRRITHQYGKERLRTP